MIPNKAKWKTSGHKDKRSRISQCLVGGGRGLTWDEGLNKLEQSLQMWRQAHLSAVGRLKEDRIVLGLTLVMKRNTIFNLPLHEPKGSLTCTVFTGEAKLQPGKF